MNGYKTYIIAAAAGLVMVANVLGWIDAEFMQKALTFLGIGGVAALRHGIAKGG